MKLFRSSNALLGRRDRLGLDQVQADLLYAPVEIQHPSCAVAKVEDTVLHIRTPVIDPGDDPLAILEVGDLNQAAEGKLAVGGSHLKHVKIFTACGGPSVKALAIPGGVSNLVGGVDGVGGLGGYFGLGPVVVWNGSRPYVGNQD